MSRLLNEMYLMCMLVFGKVGIVVYLAIGHGHRSKTLLREEKCFFSAEYTSELETVSHQI